MKIGLVSGRRSKEAAQVIKECGRAVYYRFGGDKNDFDAEEGLTFLPDSVDVWNDWRAKNRRLRPYFQSRFLDDGANLSGVDLSRCVVDGCDFVSISFKDAKLSYLEAKSAVFDNCDFSGADLRSANFFATNFNGCDFTDARLDRSFLVRSLLRRCDFSRAKLSLAEFGETDFIATLFPKASGMHRTVHLNPSTFDVTSVGSISSSAFLFKAGVPKQQISLARKIVGGSMRKKSCFISFSHRDQRFASKLHRDLCRDGVTCWFAPHDLPFGSKTYDVIDEQISKLDRLVVILSENSVKSEWVEDEVSKAFAEERRRSQTVLLPIMIDSVAINDAEPWVQKLRNQRNVGNFDLWEDRARYKKSYSRLLKALQPEDDQGII